MKKNQHSKIAIITGGASGLGFAIAKKIVANRIFSILIGRDNNKLQEAYKSLGTPSEVADAALFPVSDEASFVNGTVLTVDGGNSIGFL